MAVRWVMTPRRLNVALCLFAVFSAFAATSLQAADADAGPRINNLRDLGTLIDQQRKGIRMEFQFRSELNSASDPVARLFGVVSNMNAAIPVSEQTPTDYDDLWRAFRILIGRAPEPELPAVVEVEEEHLQVKEERKPVELSLDDLWRRAEVQLELNPEGWITAANGELIAQMPDGDFLKKGSEVDLHYRGDRYVWSVESVTHEHGIQLRRVRIE